MTPDIAPGLLRSFLAIVEAGGFAAAASRRNRSQPALSLQMKRLESALGTRLFRREGRKVRLTRDGAAFERQARRILDLHDEVVSSFRNHAITGTVRIGLIQDLADALTADLLARFTRTCPGVHLEARVDMSASLVQAYAAGDLDIVLAPVSIPGAEVVTLGEEALCWLGAPDFAALGRDVLPLVACDESCSYRRMATSALDAAGRRWTMAMTSPSLAGVLTAVRAGIGITIRGESVLDDGIVVIPDTASLPALPAVTYCLSKRAAPGQPAVDALAGMLVENNRFGQQRR